MNAAMIGLNLGEARRRQERAKLRGERFKVGDEVREERAAIMAARDAVSDQQQAEAQAERDALPSALQAVLNRGSIDELAEIARMIGRLDGRRMEGIVSEIFRAKSRKGNVPEPEMPAIAADPTEQSEKAAAESVKRRGRPPGSQAA